MRSQIRPPMEGKQNKDAEQTVRIESEGDIQREWRKYAENYGSDCDILFRKAMNVFVESGLPDMQITLIHGCHFTLTLQKGKGGEDYVFQTVNGKLEQLQRGKSLDPQERRRNNTVTVESGIKVENIQTEYERDKHHLNENVKLMYEMLLQFVAERKCLNNTVIEMRDGVDFYKKFVSGKEKTTFHVKMEGKEAVVEKQGWLAEAWRLVKKYFPTDLLKMIPKFILQRGMGFI